MNDFLNTFLGGLAYSLLGFVVGWLVGHEAQTIEEIRDAVVSEEEADAMDRNVRERTRLGKVGIFLIVMAIFTVIQSAYFSFEQNKATKCLAEYNNDLASVQQVRAKWADEDRKAMMDFFDTYQSQPPPNQEERIRAFEKLTSTYDKNTERRKDTPLPHLKRCD